MLKVQEWLRQNNFQYSLLEEQLGIKSTFHPTDNRVILNYSQIDSPKTNDIVKECRGLVLDKMNANLIARAFPRFYNWGELQHEERWFDWNNSISYEKVDGSLIISYELDGNYHFNTRGTFGDGRLTDGLEMTWKQLIELAQPNLSARIHSLGVNNLTLVWEICSRYNQVVRIYNEPTLYLLTAFSGEQEVTDETVDNLAKDLGVHKPQKWYHNDVFDVFAHVNKISENDLTFEGCVIRDIHNHRWKIKSNSYIHLHKTVNNQALTTERIIKIILDMGADEFCLFFPALENKVKQIESNMKEILKEIKELWPKIKNIDSQKAFSLRINNLKYKSVLFSARKQQKDPADCFNEKIWNKILNI